MQLPQIKRSLLLSGAISALLIATLFFFTQALTAADPVTYEVAVEGLDLAPDTHTVLDFAASWCQPCYEALPHLQRLATQHDGLDFRVVCVDEKEEDCARLSQAVRLEIPLVWDGDHQIISRFSPDGFPATYVLDPQGTVVHHHQGTSRRAWQEFAEFLAALEPPAAR